MTTNRAAAAATAFSRVCAAPPPFTTQPDGATWSAPSIAMSSSASALGARERLDCEPELARCLLGRERRRDAAQRQPSPGERRAAGTRPWSRSRARRACRPRRARQPPRRRAASRGPLATDETPPGRASSRSAIAVDGDVGRRMRRQRVAGRSRTAPGAEARSSRGRPSAASPRRGSAPCRRRGRTARPGSAARRRRARPPCGRRRARPVDRVANTGARDLPRLEDRRPRP